MSKHQLYTPVLFEDISGGVTRETVLAWAKKTKGVLAVSREDGADDDDTRPHYHVAIDWGEAISDTTHRKRLHTAFPHMKAGKTGMSSRKWDGSVDLYDYIYKGNKKNKDKGFDNVFCRANIDIAYHHNHWHDEHLRINQGKTKESSEDRKERFIKETIQHFKGRKPLYMDISRHLFTLYKGRVQLNHLQPMALHILFELDPEQAHHIHDQHVLAWFERMNKI